MTIAFAEAPSEARNAVLDALKTRGKAGSLLTPQLRAADPNLLDILYAVRTVHLPLDKIDPKDNPQKPLRQLVEAPLWRFQVTAGSKAIAAAYGVEVGAGTWRLGEVAEGPVVAGTEAAIDKANKDPNFQRIRYEPVLLQAPALAVVALWLRAPDPANDVVLPIPPSKPPFSAFSTIPPTGFVARLYEKAQTIPRDATTSGG